MLFCTGSSEIDTLIKSENPKNHTLPSFRSGQLRGYPQTRPFLDRESTFGHLLSTTRKLNTLKIRDRYDETTRSTEVEPIIKFDKKIQSRVP